MKRFTNSDRERIQLEIAQLTRHQHTHCDVVTDGNRCTYQALAIVDGKRLCCLHVLLTGPV